MLRDGKQYVSNKIKSCCELIYYLLSHIHELNSLLHGHISSERSQEALHWRKQFEVGRNPIL